MKGLEGKMDRKTVEKNRRMRMKSLCFKLATLVPKQDYFSKDIMPKYNLLDEARTYILQLKERIERLKKKKEFEGKDHKRDQGTDDTIKLGFKLPVIEIRNEEPNLEVLLISGSEKILALHQVIRILEEEGAEVVNANFSIVGDKIFYTIHSQAISARIGLEASKVDERLHQLIA